LLLYPLVYALAKPLYGSGIGKAFLAVLSKLHLLVPIVSAQEKQGRMGNVLHRMPEPCAALAHEQFARLRTLNAHRRSLTRFYYDAFKERGWKLLDGITPDLPLQKFPLFTQDADGIRRTLKHENIHLSDGWTGCVVCPDTVDPACAQYAAGSDPHAESVSQAILSLPTHPTTTHAQAAKLVERLSPLLHS
jgi:dTDP-4-amino-4,6-dideoxygalactose transaminase